MAGCNQEWFDNLSGYHDGELTPEDRARVEVHLTDCAACRRASALLGELRESLRADIDKPIPERVRKRAQAVIDARRTPRQALAGGGALLVAAAAAFFFFFFFQADMKPSFREELVAHHLSGFAKERPYDFESSDPAEVGAWLQTQLGYAVDVPVHPGVQLIGARLCKIIDVHTAALMYRVEAVGMDPPPLTVFIPPPSSPAAVMARNFAGDGIRCTRGALGSSICVRHESQPMLAVANARTSSLTQMLAGAN